MNITLTGGTPVVATESLTDILEDIKAGNITGDSSKWGDKRIVGVYDIEELGLSGQVLNGVTLPTSGLFVRQSYIGDTNCDDLVNSDDYNAMVDADPSTSPDLRSDQGYWPPQPNLSWLCFMGWFKVQQALGALS